jgi:hypothetical protein
MIPRIALRIGLLAAAFALGTTVLGWVAVPLAAGMWGLIDRNGAVPGRVAALAATLAWGTLLMIQLSTGRAGELASGLGGSLGVPAILIVVVTLALPAILAWSSATTVWLVANRVGGRSRTD